MRFLSFLLLIILTSYSAFSQEKISISGRVTEKLTGEALPGASVLIVGSNTGCITTPNGYFRLLVPSGNLTVQFSFIGYNSKKVDLSNINLSEPVNVELEPDEQQLSEINVITEKEKIFRMSDNSVSTVALSPKLIEKLPNFGEVDILRSFQLLPGISASNEASAGLYIHGGTPDQNLILFDGMPVYHVDHFYGFFSAFNANSIDDITLYKGCFPAKFGGRLSSVMELNGRTADISRYNWSTSFSLLSVNGMVELPLIRNKLSLQVSGRRSYTDIIKSGVYKNIFALYDNSSTESQSGGEGRFGRMTVEVEPTFYFYDLNSKLTWFATENDKLSLAFYSGKDYLDNSRESEFTGFSRSNEKLISEKDTETVDLSTWGNVGVSLKWDRSWTHNLFSTLSLSYSNYFSNRKRGTEADDEEIADSVSISSFSYYEDNNVNDASITFDNRWELGENHTLEFGGKYTYNNITYQYAQNDSAFLLNQDQKGSIVAFYLQDNAIIFSSVNIKGGVRVSYFDLTGRFYFEPRFSAIYHATDKLRLNLGWGLYNQFITRTSREDIMAGSNDFWMMAGANDIPVGYSQQFLSGVAYENSGFLFSVEGYYKQLDGLSEFTMRYSNRRFDSDTYKTIYTGSGVARGVELLAQKKAGSLTGWIAYTLSSVIHNFPELNNGKDFYASHDQTHELKTIITQSVGNWDFSLTWIFSTGTPYTAPEGIYELEMLNGDRITYIHVGDKNAYRLPDYHRMDISANFNFFIGNARAILGASVFNLYNHTNIWYKEFEFDDATGELIETNISKLGFTPNISLKVYLR